MHGTAHNRLQEKIESGGTSTQSVGRCQLPSLTETCDLIHSNTNRKDGDDGDVCVRAHTHSVRVRTHTHTHVRTHLVHLCILPLLVVVQIALPGALQIFNALHETLQAVGDIPGGGVSVRVCLHQ